MASGFLSSSQERADGRFESRRFGVGTTTGYRGPDAQWGGLAEHAVSSFISRGPAFLTVERSSEAVLADSPDPLTLEQRTDSVTVNGREYTSHYDATLRRLTRTSPEGRVSLVDLDSRGRPVAVQLGTLLPTTLSYDARGRLKAIEQGPPPPL